MNLLDQFLYELDGESSVRDDAATARLEALLAEARKLTPPARLDLQAEVTRLRTQVRIDVELRRSVHADLLVRATSWDERAAAAPPSFAAQAKERADGIRAEVVAAAEEISEYDATIRRLDEIYLLLERASRP